MTTRKRPTVTADTEIDDKPIDLNTEHVTDKHGRRITDDTVDDIVAAFRKPGRPSLAKSGTSPTVAFRLPPELRDKAARVAAKEGKSVSALAREALEKSLQSK